MALALNDYDPMATVREAMQYDPMRALREAGALDPMRALREAGALDPMRALREAGALDPMRALREAGALDPMRALREAGALDPMRALHEAIRNLSFATRPLLRDDRTRSAASRAVSEILLVSGVAVSNPNLLPQEGATAASGSYEGERIWELLQEISPQLAQAIDQQSMSVSNSFLSRRVARGALAASIWAVILGLYVGGAMLPPPFNILAGAVTSTIGVAAPAAVRKVNDRLDGGSQA